MNEEKKKNLKRVKILTLIFLMLSLFLLLGGVTFAIYSKLLKGTTENVIQAGSISFSYNEDSFQGNGIKIENASYTPDSFGKLMNGVNEYFDFSVNAQSTLADVSYQVIVQKSLESTLNDKFVKIYVTTKSGNVETPSPLVMENDRVLTYDDLNATKDRTGKVAYIGTVKKGSKDYHQEFRLRMWLADDVQVEESIYDKMFSVKVKIVATEIR